MKDAWEPPRRSYNDEDDEEEEEADEDEIEDEADRDAEDEGDAADNSWDKDAEGGNEVNPADGLQDLQYFPNFYQLLRSLDSGENKKNCSLAEEELHVGNHVCSHVSCSLRTRISSCELFFLFFLPAAKSFIRIHPPTFHHCLCCKQSRRDAGASPSCGVTPWTPPSSLQQTFTL